MATTAGGDPGKRRRREPAVSVVEASGAAALDLSGGGGSVPGRACCGLRGQAAAEAALGHVAASDSLKGGGWTCPVLSGHVRRGAEEKIRVSGGFDPRKWKGGPIYSFWEVGESK